MLVTVIQAQDYQTTKRQLLLARQQTDAVELRLDYASILDLNAIAKLRQAFHLPMIFTLRKSSQGGFYPHTEAQRLKDILSLCEWYPDFIDVEYDVPEQFLQEIKHRYPAIKLICSYHHFKETPKDLVAILQSMQHPCFYAYKIATQANTTADAIRMLHLIQTTRRLSQNLDTASQSQDNNYPSIFSGICMGEYGQSTRILGPIIGNAMTYVTLENSKNTAPGQLTLDDLLSIYHFRHLNSATKIYALLGDPVDASAGHALHNQAIEFLNENAVYIKLRTTQHELATIINLCRDLPFAGFSITMPLKESILPLLDDIEKSSQPIKAVNTIVKHQEKYLGLSTDGIGAINALAKKINVAQQKVVILGAGGAARAIAYEALQRKATVTILNRTVNKAKQLADQLGCTGDDLNMLPKLNYHILINTLPESVYAEKNLHAWLHAQPFLPNAIAMDIVYQNNNTAFLQHARQSGCICLLGHEMYVEQAALQIERWFDPGPEKLTHIKNMMSRYFLHE